MHLYAKACIFGEGRALACGGLRNRASARVFPQFPAGWCNLGQTANSTGSSPLPKIIS